MRHLVVIHFPLLVGRDNFKQAGQSQTFSLSSSSVDTILPSSQYEDAFDNDTPWVCLFLNPTVSYSPYDFFGKTLRRIFLCFLSSVFIKFYLISGLVRAIDGQLARPPFFIGTPVFQLWQGDFVQQI